MANDNGPNGDRPDRSEGPELVQHEHNEPDTQPVDRESPPVLPFTVVGVGASAGGLEAYTAFIGAMPPDAGMAYVLVQHLSPKHESMVAEILGRHTRMTVRQVEDGMPVEPNTVYVIRPGHTMTVEHGVLRLGASLLTPGQNRPVDDFFRSLAIEQRERAVAVILSGMESNGTAGAQMIKAVGGVCIAQDPESAKFPSMPRALIDTGLADFILRPEEIPEVLLRYASHPYAKGLREEQGSESKRERQALIEILTILRTRTRNDFRGYKKPTVLRRVQRRMGLNQIVSMHDYARTLRQNTIEAAALSDDLLIHVTGFFRDRDVWDQLNQKVIVPLVAEREEDSTIRCWVTACSSGEEAYTLGILLLEAAERAKKTFRFKIFATDMAERSLAHARSGVYPGGIESEVDPERLEKFFDKEEGYYRVKQFLRETVVFAPQNVLQDPPFSRLDIATCRNLLIYLEADVQQRLLTLLHFGLREGGTLLLGNSETLGESHKLFEPIDKTNRIYRRVGQTQHGSIRFPVPHTLLARSEPERGPQGEPRSAVRATVPQAVNRVLLERFTPAAVVIDRQNRVVYFHGQTEPFLTQPAGEPTRDVLTLSRDAVRGAVRQALSQTLETGNAASFKTVAIDTETGRHRVRVSALPLEGRVSSSYFLIIFELIHEPVVVHGALPGDGDGGNAFTGGELARVRDELLAAVTELQTNNEELKTSHEEITSINEELQSTNEELEISKEELQSLNEELNSVNAQLTAKMDELERTTNDLTSLLSSTDIAVIFLDTQFRIRRFTPAVRPLVEMINADIGRPLRDLSLKFDDPRLLDDAAEVLEKLIPLELEVAAGDRTYLRRVLPYRTADDRITGVVITLTDISRRTAAEAALRQSEEQYRLMVQSVRDHAMFQMDLNGTIVSWNPAAERVLGFTAEQAIGQPITIIFTPEDRAAGTDRSEMKTALEKGRAIDERWHVRSDGRRLWGSGSLALLSDPTGKPRGFVKVLRDATDRKLAEVAKAESEARFRAMADVVPDLLWESNADGQTNWYNQRWYEYTGQAAAKAGGFSWIDVIHPDDRAASLADYQAALDAGVDFRHEHRMRSATGAYRWFLAQARPLRDESGKILRWFGAATDINEQRQHLEALRESEERFRMAIAAANMGFWDWDVEHNVVKWEPTHNRMFGLPPDQKIGSVEQFMQCIHPDDRAMIAQKLKDAVEHRMNYVAEFRAVHPDGAVRWIAGYGRAFDSDGVMVKRMIGGVLDITDRKRVEQDRADLLEAEQSARALAEAANNTKDQFLANASHELRTPLSAILLWSNLLQGAGADEAMMKEGLTSIEHSAKSQQRLIEDLMDTARISAGKIRLDVKPADLAAHVATAVETVRPTAEAKGVELHADLAKDVGHVLADADRVEQIVWNLLSNAVKFTPAGGRVDLAIRRSGRQVEIRVSDTGEGIPPDQLPNVFTRFRQVDPTSTRRHGGLGLGLAISRQLVELHGGTIGVASEGIGRGSTFTVTLPLPRRTADAKGAPGPRATAGTLGGIRVLLVEDDLTTRNGLARVMGNAGATVEAVGHVDEALAAIRRQRPNVIVSDIGLPDRDGHSFLRQVRADDTLNTPRLPALALSAFNRPQDRARALESGFDDYLSKPVETATLVGLLRQVLGME